MPVVRQLTAVRVDLRVQLVLLLRSRFGALPVPTAVAKFKEARFLSDLAEDDLWEHLHVEAWGDDHVSIPHAGS